LKESSSQKILKSNRLKKLIRTATLTLAISCFSSAALAAQRLSRIHVTYTSDSKYQQALSKLQEGLVIQSGLDAAFESLSKQLETKLSHFYSDLYQEQVQFIAIMGATTYSAVVQKRIEKSFKNPWFSKVTHSISLSEKHGDTKISIPF
jgi:Zn-dependent M16 (insulinase) family peptidase